MSITFSLPSRSGGTQTTTKTPSKFTLPSRQARQTTQEQEPEKAVMSLQPKQPEKPDPLSGVVSNYLNLGKSFSLNSKVADDEVIRNIRSVHSYVDTKKLNKQDDYFEYAWNQLKGGMTNLELQAGKGLEYLENVARRGVQAAEENPFVARQLSKVTGPVGSAVSGGMKALEIENPIKSLSIPIVDKVSSFLKEDATTRLREHPEYGRPDYFNQSPGVIGAIINLTEHPVEYTTHILGQQAPTFLSQVGVSLYTGGVGALVYMGILGGGETFGEAIEAGVDTDEALKLATTRGVIEGVLEKAGLDRVLGDAGTKQISSSFSRSLLSTLSRAPQAALAEGSTEGLQEMIANAIAKNYDENRSLFDNVGDAVFGGALLGGLAGTTAGAVRNVQTARQPKELVPPPAPTKSNEQFVVTTPKSTASTPGGQFVADLSMDRRTQGVKYITDDTRISTSVPDGDYVSVLDMRTISQNDSAFIQDVNINQTAQEAYDKLAGTSEEVDIVIDRFGDVAGKESTLSSYAEIASERELTKLADVPGEITTVLDNFSSFKEFKSGATQAIADLQKAVGAEVPKTLSPNVLQFEGEVDPEQVKAAIATSKVLKPFDVSFVDGQYIVPTDRSVDLAVAQRRNQTIEVNLTPENIFDALVYQYGYQNTQDYFEKSVAVNEARGKREARKTQYRAKNITKSEAKAQLARFPFLEKLGVTIETSKAIVTPNGKKAYGLYSNGMIKLVENPDVTTAPHEALHAYLDLMLTQDEKQVVLETYRSKMESPEADIMEVEEQLAQDFAEYFVAKEKSRAYTNSRITTKIKKIFDRIANALKRIFRADNRSDMEKLYENITANQSAFKRIRERYREKRIDDIVKYQLNDPKPTTQILIELGGRASVSRQFIEDLTNKGNVKQVERDLIRFKLAEFEGDTINVQAFSDSVQMDLLPLERQTIGEGNMGDFFESDGVIGGEGRYESVTLPPDVRGAVADYSEHIYESPVETSAGGVHFDKGEYPNYFAHSRIEDMADGSTRRVIEVQSDLFQKGRLEGEKGAPKTAIYKGKQYLVLSEGRQTVVLADPKNPRQAVAEPFIEDVQFEFLEDRLKELASLQPYRNTWWERIIREEIKRSAQDGKTTLQFPTGETAMKIEGLGTTDTIWFRSDEDMDEAGFRSDGTTNQLTPENVVVGEVVYQGNVDSPWIVTETLEDGKFRAIPEDVVENKITQSGLSFEELVGGFNQSAAAESFDISGKIDTNNPIYKFYEKDVQKYLKRIHPEMKQVTDENGITWFEVKPTQDDADRPVVAFQEMDRVGEEDPLMQEARKYKSAEEFVEKIQGSATQYGEYTPQFRVSGIEGYENITKLGVDPEEFVTIYRGIDDTTGKIPREINDGDFVTTDFDSARAYAANPEDVVSMEVKAKDLYVDEPEGFEEDPFFIGAEYIYTRKGGEPLTRSQLTDIWNQANNEDSSQYQEAKRLEPSLRSNLEHRRFLKLRELQEQDLKEADKIAQAQFMLEDGLIFIEPELEFAYERFKNMAKRRRWMLEVDDEGLKKRLLDTAVFSTNDQIDNAFFPTNDLGWHNDDILTKFQERYVEEGELKQVVRLKTPEQQAQKLKQMAERIVRRSEVGKTLSARSAIRQLIVNPPQKTFRRTEKQLLKARIRAQAVGGREATKTVRKQIQDRRVRLRAMQSYFGFSDAHFRKVSKRDFTKMTDQEFEEYLRNVGDMAVVEAERSAMKARVMQLIREREYKNWESLVKAMELPPVSEMNMAQLEQFESAIEPYRFGDIFLSKRRLETIDNTKLAGAKTLREIREALAGEAGIEVEDLSQITIKGEKFLNDVRLAKKDPFYAIMVKNYHGALAGHEVQKTQIENEFYKRVKASRKSRGLSVAERLIPQDDIIMRWLETPEASKGTLEKTMTPEDLELAHFMWEMYRQFRDKLVEREVLDKARENYYTHVRRNFLETAKDDGLKTAFKELFEQQELTTQTFKIIDDDTSTILPLEKFFQFAMQRTGELTPTKNVAKAFQVYLDTFYKKLALDSVVPLIDTYTYAIENQETTKTGLQMDRSLRKFVNEWLNNKRGRPFSFGNAIRPGGKIDSTLRFAKAALTLQDLGLSVSIGTVSYLGDTLSAMKGSGPKVLALGTKRMATKQGRDLLKKYEGFVGRGPLESLFLPTKDIGQQLLETAFILFKIANRTVNSQYFLGSLTQEEMDAGEVSPTRITDMKLKMGKYRHVSDFASVIGSTSLGTGVLQYKSWAVPHLTATVDNWKVILKKMSNKETRKEVLNTPEFREEMRGLLIVAVIYLLVAGYQEDDDDSFFSELRSKAIRELFTSIQAIDPNTWTSAPRMASFVAEFVENMTTLLKREEYKTTDRKGDLKGPVMLRRQFTPRAIDQFLDLD